MKQMIPVILAVTALAGHAAAQQVVFHDGFENGLAGWTASGLWNLEDSADACGAQVAPFPGGSKAAWYGVDGACNFATGSTNSGILGMNGWVDLPDAPSISLRFWWWSRTELCGGTHGQWDMHRIAVQAQDGPDAGFVQDLCDWSTSSVVLLPWHERRVDLSAYRGARVRVHFEFDAIDDGLNHMLGWLIDEVTILAEPGQRVCPSAALDSDCPCMPSYIPVAGGCRNSTGQSATLLSGGAPSVSLDTLTFTAAHMPPGTSPTLFSGTSVITPAVFGDGLRCTGGAQVRLGTQVASAGVSSWPSPGSPSLSAIGMPPLAGETRYYQVIYRNAATFCLPATFNLTDAQRIVWAP